MKPSLTAFPFLLPALLTSVSVGGCTSIERPVTSKIDEGRQWALREIENADGSRSIGKMRPNGTKEGSWQSFHVNGWQKNTAEYAGGKKHGLWTAWYASGSKKEEGAYKNGEREGLWNYWGPSGGPALKTGVEAFWAIEKYDDGRKMAEGFKNSLKQKLGSWTYWDEKGLKWKEGQFQGGKEEGLWTYWYEKGQKWKEGEYQGGKQQGFWTRWYEKGQEWSEGAYHNGKEEGLWTYWNEDGTVNSLVSGIYKAGKRIAPLPDK